MKALAENGRRWRLRCTTTSLLRLLFFDDQPKLWLCVVKVSQRWFRAVYKILDSQLQQHPVQQDATFLSISLFGFIPSSDDFSIIITPGPCKPGAQQVVLGLWSSKDMSACRSQTPYCWIHVHVLTAESVSGRLIAGTIGGIHRLVITQHKRYQYVTHDIYSAFIYMYMYTACTCIRFKKETVEHERTAWCGLSFARLGLGQLSHLGRCKLRTSGCTRTHPHDCI
jgi:hypothetical protein